MIKIWVDDLRTKPEGYDIWCKSTSETIEILQNTYMCEISVLDLDHDAGDYVAYGGDYIKILDWMVENGYRCPVRLHTGNPVGRDNMWRLMKRYHIPEYEYEFD